MQVNSHQKNTSSKIFENSNCLFLHLANTAAFEVKYIFIITLTIQEEEGLFRQGRAPPQVTGPGLGQEERGRREDASEGGPAPPKAGGEGEGGHNQGHEYQQ